MARQRNNIYAVAADAVDLALDTAGTIGNMVGGVAHMIGIGGGAEKTEKQEREEADDAGKRVATSLRQEVEAAAPRPHKAKAKTRVSKPRAKSAKKVVKRALRKAS